MGSNRSQCRVARREYRRCHCVVKYVLLNFRYEQCQSVRDDRELRGKSAYQFTVGLNINVPLGATVLGDLTLRQISAGQFDPGNGPTMAERRPQNILQVAETIPGLE